MTPISFLLSHIHPLWLFLCLRTKWDVKSTEKSCSSRAKALLMIEVDTSNFDKVRYGLERIQVSRVYRLFVSNRGTG